MCYTDTVLPWLPVCTRRHSLPKKIKQLTRDPLMAERYRLKFLRVQMYHPLAATTKCHFFLQLFVVYEKFMEIYGHTHIIT